MRIALAPSISSSIAVYGAR